MNCPFNGKPCDKPKTLSIVENNLQFNFCEDCIGKFEFILMSNPVEFSLDLSGSNDIKCKCGITFMMMVKSGKLGCGECYKTFANYLLPVIERCHKSKKHTGKFPYKIKINHNILDLEKDMKIAISEEDYESAAKIRDKIKELKNERGIPL